MNPQGRYAPIVTQSQGSGQEISLVVASKSELFLVHPSTECIITPCGSQLCVKRRLLDNPPWADLGFASCLLYPACHRKPKFRFTRYVNILKGKVSFGALLSSRCPLVLSILCFLGSVLSILSCLFSRSFAQGNWSIILKKISPFHHGQVLLKNR